MDPEVDLTAAGGLLADLVRLLQGDGLVTLQTSDDARHFGASSEDRSGTVRLEASVGGPDEAVFDWQEEVAERPRVEIVDPGGATTDVRALAPGEAVVTLTVSRLTDGGPVVEPRLAVPLAVPQFVRVVMGSGFGPALGTLGLRSAQDAVVRTIAETARALLVPANVRLVFATSPLNESMPAHLARSTPRYASLVTVAQLDGDPPPALAGKLGVTVPHPSRAGADVGPDDYDERVVVFAGSLAVSRSSSPLPDLSAALVRVRGELSGSAPDAHWEALGVLLAGRVLGQVLAHEVTHSLIGPDALGGASVEGHHATPRGALMDNGVQSLQDGTGIDVTDAAAWPAPGSYRDHGVAGMSQMSTETVALLRGVGLAAS